MEPKSLSKLTSKIEPRLVHEVDQKLNKVRTRVGSIMAEEKCTLSTWIACKTTPQTGTQSVLQKLIKS